MTRTISYAPPRRGVPARLDLTHAEHPVGTSVLIVHGGGWVGGSRRMPAVRSLTQRLTAGGWHVGAMDYRLLGRGGGWAASTADVIAATRRFSDQVEGPVVLLGLSAGGALALHTAEHCEVAGVAVGYGVTDFDGIPLRQLGAREVLHQTRDPQVWRARSPVHNSHTPAPVLLMHGERDTLVPVAHALALHQARTQRGLPTALHTYPTARHGFFALPFTTEFTVAMDDLTAFLAQLGR